MAKTTPARKFVVCVRPGDSEDLQVRKVYEALPDQKAAREGYLRIVDESGEDYLYPAHYFALIKLPAAAIRELSTPSREADAPAHH
jgi:hypothetical protein